MTPYWLRPASQALQLFSVVCYKSSIRKENYRTAQKKKSSEKIFWANSFHLCNDIYIFIDNISNITDKITLTLMSLITLKLTLSMTLKLMLSIKNVTYSYIDVIAKMERIGPEKKIA